jgi:hypothetical protein
MEMLAHALQTGLIPPETTLIEPRSFPALESLLAVTKKTGQAAGR